MTSLIVELPAYGYTFTVQLPGPDPEPTILSLKTAISTTCPGKPRIEGQRIIWSGRLLRDEERVIDLWPANDAEVKRVVHLSVHPSAWSGNPPNPSGETAARRSEKGKEKETIPVNPSSNSHLPSYILLQHQRALAVLTLESPPPLLPPEARDESIEFVRRHGFTWPQLLDQDYPTTNEKDEEGVKYVKDVIHGRPYLRLSTPASSQPTAKQSHAFKVLSYTMEMLKLPVLPPSATRTIPASLPPGSTDGIPIPAHLNNVLQQMGLPPITMRELHVESTTTTTVRQGGEAHAGVQVINLGAFDANGNPVPVQNAAVHADGPLQNILQALQGANANVNPAAQGNPPQGPAQQPRPPIPPLQLLPIFFLLLRTLLLLYFFSPARKPFLLILLIGWLGWEMREVFARMGFGRLVRGWRQWERILVGGREGEAGAGIGANGAAQAPPPPPAPNNGAGPAPVLPQVPPQVANDAVAGIGANGAVPPNLNNGQVAVNGNGAGNVNGNVNNANSFLDTLSSWNMEEDEAALGAFTVVEPTTASADMEGPTPQPVLNYPLPSLASRILSFFILLITTAHPAVWNRRRKLLAQREGRVRVELRAVREAGELERELRERSESREGDANISGEGSGSTESDASDTVRRLTTVRALRAKFFSRPEWVKRYMRRVDELAEVGEGEEGVWEEWRE